MALAAVYGVLLFAIVYGRGLLEPYAAYDDATQHIFWMYQWTGASGFVAGDPIVRLAELIQPAGFWALYRLLTQFGDPLFVSKLLSGALLVTATVFCFLLVRRHSSLGVAVGMSLLMTASVMFWLDIMGGFARSFKLPFLFAGLYFLDRGSLRIAAGIIALAAAFYPPLFVILTAVYIVAVGFRARFRLRPWGRALIPLAFGLALAVAVVIFDWWQVTSSEVAGPMFSRQEILRMPEFSRRGRVPFARILELPIAGSLWSSLSIPVLSDLWHLEFPFLPDPWRLDWIEPSIRPINEWVIPVGRVVLLGGWAVVLASERTWTRLDTLIATLIVTGVALFLLARVVAPVLYLPNRYLVGLEWVPALAGLRVLTHLRLRRYGRVLFGVTVAILLVPAVYMGLFWWGQSPDQSRQALYDSISEIPGEAMVAAPPGLANYIPLFTQKSTLVSAEASHAVYFQNYWTVLKKRTYDLFEAYFADEMDTVLRVADRYELDYLVVDREDFGEPYYYFAPFGSYVEDLSSGREPGDYVVNQIRGRCVEQVDERYRLVDLHCLAGLQSDVDRNDASPAAHGPVAYRPPSSRASTSASQLWTTTRLPDWSRVPVLSMMIRPSGVTS